MGLYLGIFLVTLSGLMFEIGLTRIFSATIWYHYAFVAISVALLGWGLGGFALHLLRGRLALSRERAAWLTLLYGLSLPLALWLIVRVPFHPDRLVVYFAVSLLPFLLAGAALSMLFAVEREHTARLYFADLAGASLGALAVTFLLSWLGGESAVPLIADHPNLLVVQTMSKSRGLAGLRVGYAIGDAGLIEALRRVKDSFNSYPLGRVAQAGAAASLRDDAYFRASCAKVVAAREAMTRELVRLGFVVLPSSANFVFARHPARGGAALAAGLRERAVLVRHFNKPRTAAWLRITVGTDDDSQRLIAAAADILGA